MKRYKRHIILFVLILSAPWSLLAQDVGFMKMKIGMTRSEVLLIAESSDLIEVPKDRDVEFFPVEDRKILTLSIKPEIPSIYMQFYDDLLLAMTVVFDERHIDYYTLVNRLEERYGKYDRVTPSRREWDFGPALIQVEKPAVVKYMAIEELIERASFTRPQEFPESERRKRILDGL